MNTHLAWMMMAVGLLGCGAQELPGGSRDAGRDLSRPVIDATERNLDDAGCPPEGKIACAPLGCTDVIPTPECVRGVWSCPVLAVADLTCPCGPVPSGCTCEPSVGISCPVDASVGPDAGRDAGPTVARDAAARCAWPVIDAGGYFTCGGCGSDSTPLPTCLGDAWTCPTGTGSPVVCPPMIRRCAVPQPPGCSCNPITGAVYCAPDAGSDASS